MREHDFEQLSLGSFACTQPSFRSLTHAMHEHEYPQQQDQNLFEELVAGDSEQRIIEGSNIQGQGDGDDSDGDFGLNTDEDASTLHYKDLTLGQEVCVCVRVGKVWGGGGGGGAVGGG